jgi:hypothetical protein
MLPVAPASYSSGEESQNRASIKRELDRKLDRGVDIEMDDARIILKSPDGTRYALGVNNSGVLTATAL